MKKFEEGDTVRHKINGREMTIEKIEKCENVDTGEERPIGTAECVWTEDDETGLNGHSKRSSFHFDELDFVRSDNIPTR